MITNEDIEKIVSFVKKEPRTIQEISEYIGKSWVTTESYVKKIQSDTGRLFMKVFRPNTQGALKIVFIPTQDSLFYDDIKESLFLQIKTARKKEDFDFLDIFQLVKDSEKKVESFKEGKITDLNKASEQILFFSGNLSFINDSYDLIEKILKRGVNIKVLCRVNFATLKNLNKIKMLMQKYPHQIEIRQRYHPLRGFILDGKLGKFRVVEKSVDYRKGELDHDLNLSYEIYDKEWLDWLQKIFWYFFRNSVDVEIRLKELSKIK